MSALDAYLVRIFDPARDLEGAYNCFVSGFHHIMWPMIDHAKRRVVEDAIMTAHGMGVATYVAEADGEARGILIGGLPFEGKEVAKGVGLLAAYLYRNFISSARNDMRPLARAHMRRVVTAYARFVILHPMSVSTETFMLTSQKEYRGGIGRALMDAWVDESRLRGFHKTTVGTDTELSWDFYERYGFRRVREFGLPAYSYSVPDRDVTGYIYSLDI